MPDKNDPIRTKYEVVDDRRVRLWCAFPPAGRWSDGAERPPYLLIHGLGCSVEVWGPMIRCLAERGLDRPVICADMPGYGRSEPPKESSGAFGAMSISELADWTARLLDVLGVARVHLAAHSMGCQVALALARRHPERAASLVLIGPTEGTNVVPFWRTVTGLFADVFLETMLYNGTLARMYLQMGPPRFFAAVKQMNADDPVKHAGKVKSPVLIVRGGRDYIVPDLAARKLAARLPRGSYTTLDHGSHAIQFNLSDAFTQIARAFWSRAEAEEAAGVTERA